MSRLFLAIPLPAPHREYLAGLDPPPGLRRVPAPRMHLTLRFIGPAEDETLHRLRAALALIDGANPTICVSGVGRFPVRGKPRVLWAGIADNPSLRELQGRAEQACLRAGLSPAGRPWRAHVTLGRFRSGAAAPVDEWVREHESLELSPFPANRILLMDSRQDRTGLRYVPIAERRLDL